MQVSFQYHSHLTSCYQELILPFFLLQISTHNYTQEQCCRSKGLFNGRHLQWIDLIPPWLTNSNTFLACPSKYDSKFGFTPSTSSRKYCHSAHHCHYFCLLVRDLTPDDGRIGKFSRQISQQFYMSTTSLVTRFGPITSFLPPKLNWNRW
jgi:hypothetical protein